MTLIARRIIIWFLSALAVFVGGWALLAPENWYTTFPDGSAGTGFGQWIMMDSPYNEHLIRDVGALYLALAGAGIVAALSRSITATRTVAVAWIVFSAPHLYYHLLHLHDMALLDAVGEPISLAVTLLLPIPLLLPDRRQSRHHSEQEGTTRVTLRAVLRSSDQPSSQR